ncbi:MAG: hypothetical protein ACREP9_18585, partial [Candidatus Dormibacteraceae bacterium]
GSLKNAIAGTTALMGASATGDGTVPSGAATTFQIIFDTTDEANQLLDPKTGLAKPGLVVVFKDSLSAQAVALATVSGVVVTITPSPSVTNASGAPSGTSLIDPTGHLAGAKILVIQPAQQVRYSIQPQFLDPSDASKGIPCLMREQENYLPAGFVSYLASGTPTADYSSTIVAENVTGLKFYLSMNPGDMTKTPDKVWAGYGYTGTDFNAGILGAGGTAAAGTLNDQLGVGGGYGVAGFTSISVQNSATPVSDLIWFRDIPVAVRADVTTRTATPRTEYNQTSTTPTLTFNTHQESLVLVPRHFGLTLR